MVGLGTEPAVGLLDLVAQLVQATLEGLDGGTLGATTLDQQSGGTSTKPDGPVTFSTKVVITSDALSHRYDRKAG